MKPIDQQVFLKQNSFTVVVFCNSPLKQSLEHTG